MYTNHPLVLALADVTPSQLRRTYLRGVEAFLDFAGTDPSKWTRAKALAFYLHLQKADEPKAHQLMAGLRRASGDAPWARVHLAPGKGGGASEPLTGAEVLTLLRTCAAREPRDLRDFGLMVLLLETGLRRTQAVDVTWADLDRAGDTVPASVRAALAPWRAWLVAERVARGPIIRKISQRGEPGGSLTPQALYPIVAARGEQTNLGAIHPDTLRYTFQCWRLADGVPLKTLKPVLARGVASWGSPEARSVAAASRERFAQLMSMWAAGETI